VLSLWDSFSLSSTSRLLAPSLIVEAAIARNECACSPSTSAEATTSSAVPISPTGIRCITAGRSSLLSPTHFPRCQTTSPNASNIFRPLSAHKRADRAQDSQCTGRLRRCRPGAPA
jgi:hypothetical protein